MVVHETHETKRTGIFFLNENEWDFFLHFSPWNDEKLNKLNMFIQISVRESGNSLLFKFAFVKKGQKT